MAASKLIMIVVAEALLNLACASQTSAVNEGSAHIALRRGGSWSMYAFKLPTISGSTAQLRLEGQTLHGFVGTGSVHIKIDNEKALGFGPSGPIDIGIRQQGGDVVVDGLWNGGPVHLVFGSTRLNGTVIAQGTNLSRQAICGYDLDHRDQRGAFVGTSICEGMPEQTRIEIDARIGRTLKPSEFAVLLVVILANPGPVR